MRLFLLMVFLWTVTAANSPAAVTIGTNDGQAERIEDVYQQHGVAYIALEDVLHSVGLKGYWDSVRHVYRITSAIGLAELSPGSQYLKIAGEFYPLQEKPRFIDGRLRVGDHFVRQQLPLLTGTRVAYVNLDPDKVSAPVKKRNPLDSLFSFLLNRKDEPEQGPVLRAVAIDPGHGGADNGVLGAAGVKEKQVTLAVAEKLARQIKMKRGIPVYLSRDGDYEMTTEQRQQEAARDDVDIWLRLHAEGALSPDVEGAAFFVRPPEQGQDSVDDSARLADLLAAAFKQQGLAVQGIFTSSRLSLGRGNLPTVQVELGYLTHRSKGGDLADPDYQQKLAVALNQGIDRYVAALEEDKNERQ